MILSNEDDPTLENFLIYWCNIVIGTESDRTEFSQIIMSEQVFDELVAKFEHHRQTVEDHLKSLRPWYWKAQKHVNKNNFEPIGEFLHELDMHFYFE